MQSPARPPAATAARILGFDFGLRRIGVAAGNLRTGSCQGLCAIGARDGAPDWTAVRRLLSDWRPGKLVVGLPRDARGVDTEITIRARNFARLMARRCRLQVALVDEYLSTAAAEQLLTASAAPTKSRRGRRLKYRDALAAELIVRTYLENTNHATAV